MALTIGLCILCHDRPEELGAALSSAGADWDERVVLDMASTTPLTVEAGVEVLRSDENKGVAAGRNELARSVTSDILVFLDDDAVFLTPVSESLRRRYQEDPRLAVVAFRIVRPGGMTVSGEYPFRGRPRRPDEPRPCAYFVGAGHAVRRQAFLEVGGYDESFFYSTEEIDLSLGLAQRGWGLAYDPTLVVEHRPSARGREVSQRVAALRLENRIVMARRHLPWGAALIHVAAWAVRTRREAARPEPRADWRRAWRRGLRRSVHRRALSLSQAWRVHRLGGRILW